MKLIKQSIRSIILILSLLVSVLLVFSFLSPLMVIADSVSHFRFHLSIVLLLLVLMVLVAGYRRTSIAALVISLAGFFSIGGYLFSEQARASGTKYYKATLLQLNLSFENSHLENVASLIRKKNADVVTLQEVTRKTSRIMTLLENDYPYRVSCSFSSVGGVAILSRLPRVHGRSQGCIGGTGMAWMRVRVKDKPVTMVSMHLHWPYPYGQHLQISDLEKRLHKLRGPFIIAGDFNAVPWSYAMDRIATASNTRVIKGLRFSFDLPTIGNLMPVGMPIDHVLISDEFVVENIELGARAGSDHNSVTARIAVPVNN